VINSHRFNEVESTSLNLDDLRFFFNSTFDQSFIFLETLEDYKYFSVELLSIGSFENFSLKF
jgi:hypothetical protein